MMADILRVLYVDDEPTLLEISKLYLERGGSFVVDTLLSAPEALVRLNTVRYDAIISDYQMPEMDGIGFLKALRTNGNTTPFIIFTGRGREEIVIQALNNGADFYLQKGGEPKSQFAELSHKIRQAVSRKRAEEALQESETRFRLVFETLPIGLWLADKKGTPLMGNPAAQQIWAAQPPPGQERYGIFKAWHMPSGEPVSADEGALGYAVNEGRTTEHELLEIEAFDGTKKHILNWAAPLKNEHGEIIGAFVINQDITETEQAHDALRQANRKLKLLTGITRHDILNNVTSILSFLELAKAKSAHSEMTTFIEKLETWTQQIRSQIEFTRLYEDIGSHTPQWLDLHAVLAQLQVPAGVSFSDDCTGTEIYADALLERVFSNLLDNSVHHGKGVSDIRISARQIDQELQVTYADNGIGIPAAEKEHIFERGYGKNTGLGLALSREILSITGITIKETGEPGRGARFEITVPKGTFRWEAGLP